MCGPALLEEQQPPAHYFGVHGCGRLFNLTILLGGSAGVARVRCALCVSLKSYTPPTPGGFDMGRVAAWGLAPCCSPPVCGPFSVSCGIVNLGLAGGKRLGFDLLEEFCGGCVRALRPLRSPQSRPLRAAHSSYRSSWPRALRSGPSGYSAHNVCNPRWFALKLWH